MTDPAERLRRALAERGRAWPGPVEAFGTIPSTNDHLRQRGRAAPAWSVVLAESQSAGRGRRGRAWVSPPGNLYLSVSLPPPLPQDKAGLIPLVAGLACAEALLEFGVEVRLKWPNDLHAGGRKLGGILAEASSAGAVLDSVVVGIGVNLRADPAHSDPGLRELATSVATLAGQAPDPCEAAAAILARLFARHAELQAGAGPALLAAWRARSVPWWGQPVEVAVGDRTERGTATDVDGSGALVLTRTDGSLVRLLAGDARMLRPAAPATA